MHHAQALAPSRGVLIFGQSFWREFASTRDVANGRRDYRDEDSWAASVSADLIMLVYPLSWCAVQIKSPGRAVFLA